MESLRGGREGGVSPPLLGGLEGGEGELTRGGRERGEWSGLCCRGLLQQEKAAERLPVLALLSIGRSKGLLLSHPFGMWPFEDFSSGDGGGGNSS